MYKGYAATEPSLEVREMEFPKKKLQGADVRVQLTHSGICHTDVSELLNEWASIGGNSKYPLCAGHEAIGRVTEVGADVKHLKVGDRVGFGYQRDSCRKCEDCKDGCENACRFLYLSLFASDTGGFASEIVAPENLAFKIPDAIPSEYAGPLLCAGATVWSPLVNNHLKPGARVAILGVGGLGHLALQFAHKLGYETAGITHSMNKADAIRGYGAKIVIDSSNVEQVKQYAGYFDMILNTISAPIDTNTYLAMLRRYGKLIYVGISSCNITLNPFALMSGNHYIGGSSIAGSKDMKNMLQFAADHNVRPSIELVKVPFDGGNEVKVSDALKRVQEGRPRFRIVLDYCVDEEGKGKENTKK